MQARSLFRWICLSLSLALLAGAERACGHDVGAEMAASARNLLAALTPEQRAKATFELKDEERHNWHFIPRARKGLPWAEMTAAQRQLGHALLSSGLSHRGFFKATTIMSLEEILRELEKANPRMARDSELYYFSVFGSPQAKGAWAWRVEGHHLSLNFTIVNGRVAASTPSFLGTNPAEVREGPRRGLRVLAAEEDLARELVNSLDAAQRRTAVYTNVAPADIITAADRKARLLKPEGLSAAQMTPAQSELLMRLIREYVQRNRPEVAEADLAKIAQAGASNLYFAWAGGLEPRQGHYYRIQGPGFLLEYDNTQNDANHIHAVWRDLTNDFGEDVLRKHYEQAH